MDIDGVLATWLQGKKLPDEVAVFGISVVWLGRLGQALQFIGALMVLAEIVGPDRLERLGRNLTRLNLLRICTSYVSRGPSFGAVLFIILSSLILTFVGIFIVTLLPYEARYIISVLLAQVDKIGYPEILFMSIIIIFPGLSAILIYISGLFLSIVLPAVMVHRSGEKLFKVFSLIFVASGFCFSMLAG